MKCSSCKRKAEAPFKLCSSCRETARRSYQKHAEARRRASNEARKQKYSRDPQWAEQVRQRQRAYVKAKPEVAHARLVRSYGLTPEQYAEMETRQGGGCAICGRPQHDTRTRKLVVDHCHQSGRVRGLLCNSCNRAIGLLGDDPGRVLTASVYLSKAATAL